ncbi:DNA repair protein RecO [Lacticaseibacillus thailandensis]|nr:DNA repair protein RecO [Lacticaseibacillus thailandensis]
MKSAPQKFRGIVISRQAYRESDLLVKILTDRFGTKMFMFNRARRPGFKLAAAILPFTSAVYEGTIRADGLSYIRQAADVSACTHISADIETDAYATYILALIDMAYPDGEPIPQWFDFAATALRRMDAGLDAAILTNIAEVQLLGAFGVAPHWQDCVVCHRRDLPLDFSEKYGGVLCQDHWTLDGRRYHASAKAIYLLRSFAAVPLARLGKVQVAPATRRELRVLLDRIYDDMVGATPRAKRFIDQMGQWQQHLQ